VSPLPVRTEGPPLAAGTADCPHRLLRAPVMPPGLWPVRSKALTREQRVLNAQH